jgi:hypothetical protein
MPDNAPTKSCDQGRHDDCPHRLGGPQEGGVILKLSLAAGSFTWRCGCPCHNDPWRAGRLFQNRTRSVPAGERSPHSILAPLRALDTRPGGRVQSVTPHHQLVVSDGPKVWRDSPSSHFLPFVATAQPSRGPPVRTHGGRPRVSGIRPGARRVPQDPRMSWRLDPDCQRIRPCCQPRIAALPWLFRRPAHAVQVRSRRRCVCVNCVSCPSR